MFQRSDRVGSRRHRAIIYQHDGTTTPHGQPTYTTETDWDAVITDWPVEIIAATGGERLRGRQVAANTTHILFGEYHGGVDCTPEMKCVINGKVYFVESVLDVDGDSRELRVEVRQET